MKFAVFELTMAGVSIITCFYFNGWGGVLALSAAYCAFLGGRIYQTEQFGQ